MAQEWERDWDSVRYCSQGCRRRRTTPEDEALEAAIVRLLAARGRSAGISGTDAARVVADGADWSALVEPARRAARRLAAAGEVEIVQGRRVVDPSTARDEFRIRRR
ncbi:DUF3253 domain-containing protein [Nocardioides sp. Soil777]|uniref:DUF3253 domain-containing protein n=1 Tax=Nocardioides sp. Soil777 TaxID=1736409 RepID=UPI000ABD52DD|nr:DUF3253 domain-containing protein [Nocardioides sp. Soil777]